jgi:hypothetical protein
MIYSNQHTEFLSLDQQQKEKSALMLARSTETKREGEDKRNQEEKGIQQVTEKVLNHLHIFDYVLYWAFEPSLHRIMSPLKYNYSEESKGRNHQTGIFLC